MNFNRLLQEKSFSKKVAFTLAEVLITLAIIGIVAALTIPSVINKYEKKLTVSKLQKTIAELSQALEMAVAEKGNGSPAELEISVDPFIGCEDIYNYVRTYMKTFKECEFGDKSCFTRFLSNDNNETGYSNNLDSRKLKSFITNSGVSVALWTHGTGYRDGWIIVDLNGPDKGPAKLGQDVFVIGWNLNSKKSHRSYIYFDAEDSEFSRDELLEDCKTTGVSCSTLIMRDGWKISDDYPWRIK